VNPPLYRHPRTSMSMARLREWGVSVLESVDTGEGLRMAPTESILAEAARRLASYTAPI
jgi:phosphopantothenoylcysteine synthetase/decarboxylase